MKCVIRKFGSTRQGKIIILINITGNASPVPVYRQTDMQRDRQREPVQ